MPASWAELQCRALGLLEHVAHEAGGVGGEDERVEPVHGRAHKVGHADQVAEQAYELHAHDRLDGRVARHHF